MPKTKILATGRSYATTKIRKVTSRSGFTKFSKAHQALDSLISFSQLTSFCLVMHDNSGRWAKQHPILALWTYFVPNPQTYFDLLSTYFHFSGVSGLVARSQVHTTKTLLMKAISAPDHCGILPAEGHGVPAALSDHAVGSARSFAFAFACVQVQDWFYRQTPIPTHPAKVPPVTKPVSK